MYCSPILRARPVSMHGYDIVARDEINPELGGAEALLDVLTGETLAVRDGSIPLALALANFPAAALLLEPPAGARRSGGGQDEC